MLNVRIEIVVKLNELPAEPTISAEGVVLSLIHSQQVLEVHMALKSWKKLEQANAAWAGRWVGALSCALRSVTPSVLVLEVTGVQTFEKKAKAPKPDAAAPSPLPPATSKVAPPAPQQAKAASPPPRPVEHKVLPSRPSSPVVEVRRRPTIEPLSPSRPVVREVEGEFRDAAKGRAR